MKKRYRLKNKRRFFTLLFVLLGIILFMSSISSVLAGNFSSEVRTITVMPGDTLWDIARIYCDRNEIREYIYQIRQLNHLDSAWIYAGQKLYLP